MNYYHILSQLDGIISPTWVLLENQSTVDVVSNKTLLRNIRKANNNMAIFLRDGNTAANLVGYLPMYEAVWFHPGSIANILSLSKVAEKYRVCYDGTNGNELLVHLSRGEMRYFQQFPRGTLYSDMTDSQETMLVNTRQ